jgi:hypothetical protein
MSAFACLIASAASFSASGAPVSSFRLRFLR